MLIFAIKICCS